MAYLQTLSGGRGAAVTGPAYERLLAAIGTEDFGEVARESVLALTSGIRRLYLFEVERRDAANLRYFSGEPGLAELIPIYNKHYLPFDPVHDAFRATPRQSDMAVQRVGPGDITPTGFRRRFFEEAGIVERVSIVQHGVGSWRVMNLARHESDGCFSDVEIDGLVGLARLLLPMLPLAARDDARLRFHPSVDRLEERFGRRCPALTPREREVCARATIGMTVEATALDLGIGKTSVLTYRRRAYQRLNVTSPFELGALVSH